jgi:sugar/nucleoside kinase (ribokinase family)
MQALFIGQTYIDVTFLAEEIPTGDEKAVARDYAISFGGNAVTRPSPAPSSGSRRTSSTSVADDWLGRMFVDMAAKYGISVHHRKVAESSLSFIMPRGGKRAIVRCRDDHYLHPFPPLNLGAARALHLDGHQPDAALHYAKLFREAGALTSLDGGGLRANTHELLEWIDVGGGGGALVRADADVARRHARLPEVARLPGRWRDARRARHGVVRRGGCGADAPPPWTCRPASWWDTNGAGDIFHGAYVHSALARPGAPWREHFTFARAASAYAIQHLGNEASLPGPDEVAATARRFEEKALASVA